VKLTATITDITTLEVDAIVNAANEQLAAGGGVCGAIFRAAGPQMGPACAAIGRCPTGDARITPGFKLPATYVIHAVGPIWHGGRAGEPELLASAYRSVMHLADARGLRSVAFPAISTGIYGYPLGDAANMASATVREALAGGSRVERVIFACFSHEALDAYRQAGVEIS
jgi:O-acetyl-ADP-ribose deacetylase (regulator of RNase III)